MAAVVWVASVFQLKAADAEQNWPSWRGPLQNGVAPQGNPPIEWSDTKNVKWKVKLPGESTATPVVWGDKVFAVTAINTGRKADAAKPMAGQGASPSVEIAQGAENPPGGRPRRGPGGPGGGGRGGMGGEKPTDIYQFAVICLDRATGRVLWQETAREEVPHQGHHQSDGSFAPSSPVTDGKHVFAYFGSRGLYSYDVDGKLQWSQDFGDMDIKMGFGEGSSPALYENTLVLKWDHQGESFIVAVDKNSGKTLWKTPREEKTSWSSPVITVVDGKPQVITTATSKIRSYDLATGKLLWETSGLTDNAIPSPVVNDGVAFCMSGFRGNSLKAIPLGKTGTISESDYLWTFNKATPYVPSPLLYKDKLYFFSNNNGVLTCLDAKTGKPYFAEERLENFRQVYASPVAAADRVYLFSRDGKALVLKQGEKLEQLASNTLSDHFDASPAIAGNQLFVRGRDNLYCIAE